jgi:hypothetical protein
MRALLLAALTLVAVPGFAAEPAEQTQSGLSPLAEKYARKREALFQEYAAKRQALVASPGFKGASPAEQEAALDKLTAEAKAKDKDAELRGGRAAADADAAKLQRERQNYLDEQRAKAAQDAARPKANP